MAFLSGVRAETIKRHNFGIKKGDKVKYSFSADEEKKNGKGVVEEVYPHFFLINNGKYRVCVGKAQLACGEHRITAKNCGGKAVPAGNFDRIKI